MIYIIISNVGLALMMLIVYLRYSRFRISSNIEIRELRKKNDTNLEEIRDLESRLFNSSKDDKEKIETLLTEIDELRKDKERELKLRLEAERQIDLANQKIVEIEKRLEDWRLVQDAVMKDSREAMFKIGNDLYKKLSDTYKTEFESNKNLIGKVSKNISEVVAKIANPDKKDSSSSKNNSPQENNEPDLIVKKLVSDLVATMKASGHLANKDYFLPANFDEQKAKFMLCDAAFVTSEKLYIFDFKSCRFLEEYKKVRLVSKSSAEANLKAKLDKYLSYLSNAKYRESILKVMSSTKAKFVRNILTVVVSSKEDLQILKEIRYYERIRKLEFELMDFDNVSDIVI